MKHNGSKVEVTYHFNAELLVGGLLLVVEGTHTHSYFNRLSHRYLSIYTLYLFFCNYID
mgnify:CR=1 FL=1